MSRPSGVKHMGIVSIVGLSRGDVGFIVVILR